MTNCQEIIDYLKTYFTIKTDELHYNITSSNYNPTIDTNVTITVTVTDGNDDPVTSHSFTLNANGTDVSLTTNSSGVATYTYTCSTWGACRFSVETYDCFINVTGWRTYKDTGSSSNPRWIVLYNETHTRVRLAYSSTQTIPASATNYGTELFPFSVSYLRPETTVMFPVYNGAMVVMCGPSQTTMQRRTIYGTSEFTASSQYWEVEWVHQGLP